MQNIDWEALYSVVVYVIKNYPLTIILYLVSCFVLGIVVSIILTLILRKFKVITRGHKYYNWAVKLYIPGIFIINIIFSLKIGVFWGVYEALKKDSRNISEQVYHTGSSYIFNSQESKREFIAGLQATIADLSKNKQDVKVQIIDIAKAHETRNKLVDKPKNWLVSLFSEKYGDRIHTLVLYGMLNSVPHVNVAGSLSYEEFDKLANQLVMLDSKNVEQSIVEKIENLFLLVLKSQFKPLIQGIFVIWGLLMLIPWAEYGAYQLIMKRKRSTNAAI